MFFFNFNSEQKINQMTSWPFKKPNPIENLNPESLLRILPKKGVEPKIGVFTPQMDGENFMENPIKMDDLGG